MSTFRLVRQLNRHLSRNFHEKPLLEALSCFSPYLSNKDELRAVYSMIETEGKTQILPLDYRRDSQRARQDNLYMNMNMNMNIKTHPNAGWILDREVRYCERLDRWDEDIVMVGRSILDKKWYLVDNRFCQGLLVEGKWPTLSNGQELEGWQVTVETICEREGLRLGFKSL